MTTMLLLLQQRSCNDEGNSGSDLKQRPLRFNSDNDVKCARDGSSSNTQSVMTNRSKRVSCEIREPPVTLRRTSGGRRLSTTSSTTSIVTVDKSTSPSSMSNLTLTPGVFVVVMSRVRTAAKHPLLLIMRCSLPLLRPFVLYSLDNLHIGHQKNAV